jgi:beta-1,2-xylosyltransferase
MHNKKGGARWLDSHRERLHLYANDASFNQKPVLVPIGSSGQAEIQNITAKTLSDYYMDVAMSNDAWQCDGGDGTCDEMR